MDNGERLRAFETMLSDTLREYDSLCSRLEKMKAEGREKSATYRQLLGKKLELRQVIVRFRIYHLIPEREQENV